MAPHDATVEPRLSLWLRVRRYAVPPSMIKAATARRRAGDWAGACAAAGVDTDLRPRLVARAHGRDLADQLRADLRHLAPDLLRWHLPRIAPDGLLRPGLTATLARYDGEGPGGERPLLLIVRTPPAWAGAGQRISLALWDPRRPAECAGLHPHPRPRRRFRLDLHRHLWDARRAGELRARSGADRPPGGGHGGLALDRWAAEAAILLRAEGRSAGPVAVRAGRHRLLLHPDGEGGARVTPAPRDLRALPVLPDAATWTLPDLELLRAGAIGPGLLHPLVAEALLPDGAPPGAFPAHGPAAGEARLVNCRGAEHRIGLSGGVLTALDHDPEEIRREELLAALGGPPLPCLWAVDEAHRRPESLDGVRERLGHGDVAGALALVEDLLGPAAALREGPLREALETAAHRRVAYGVYRTGLTGPVRPGPPPFHARPRTDYRTHPRHASRR
ncbi:hypothetical protein RM780_00440 [Streptomyces sp. DSM 44917]|uniref:Uncharacterized protein n=1 Tax=Streptomyces boetiae TaxID=3075541 RepID=A0ABU2L1K6_9ACTN|nr:hypothetical protein [Streptomyces sp. DSM 44917]MDT0305433.1 hypothetical protein [Streptomyces sp. DSM 44917]